MTRNDTAYLAAVEQELREILVIPRKSIAPLYQMMQYHMGWLDHEFQPREAPRGKRLRPLLCLTVCEAVGGNWHRAVPAACSLELVHNFSLLHDDIEDRSETRRHRATVWSLWGIAQGINTGDAMWALARRAMWRLSERGYEAEIVLRAASMLDQACLALCCGQYLDLYFETVDIVSLVEYEDMIAGKTAALLSAALSLGALLGGAQENVVAAYAACGHALGMTFQVVDDILGIWGDPAVTGKSAASDILTKKKTLPTLYALHWERERGYSDLKRIYAQPSLSSEDLNAVLALLDRAGARAFADAEAYKHQQQALAYLEAIQVSYPAQGALKDLILSMLSRSS